MRIVMDWPWWLGWYLAPFIPLATRVLLVLVHRHLAAEGLDEEELDREAHISVTLTLTGFSFSAVIAMALLQPRIDADLQLPLYLLLVSFLGFLMAANGESYKGKRWEDQLVTASREIGSLGLILGLVVLIISADFAVAYEILVSSLALGVWAFDHLTRIRLQWSHLNQVKVTDEQTSQ